jgi:hypothetical protein
MGLWCALKRMLFGSAGSQPAAHSQQSSASADMHKARGVGAVAYGIAQSQQSGANSGSSAVSPAAMTAAVAAYNALPPDQQTPERARELGVGLGMWNALNNSPPPAS